MSDAGRPRPRATPRAALPRRVYVVRRLLVVGVPLLVIGLVVWWFAGRGSAAAAPEEGPTATVTTSTSGTTEGESKDDDKDDAKDGDKDDDKNAGEDSDAAAALSKVERAARAAGVTVCGAADLDVDFEATASTYPGADKPAFRIVVTNTGEEPCLLEAGDANRRVAVTSGDDLVWSSTHCQADEPASRPLLLGPAAPSEEIYTWPRIRSAKGCGSAGDAPRAGTYTAKLEIDGEVVGKAVFDLG